MHTVVVAILIYAITNGIFSFNIDQMANNSVDADFHEDIQDCDRKEILRRRRSSYSPETLHCPPCNQIHCRKHSKRLLRCKGGSALDICGCCKVCAKLEGQQCGGQHEYLGKCDRGLFCKPQVPKEVTVFMNGTKRFFRVERGVCIKAVKKTEPLLEICKPKCDPKFCIENPRGICSAANNCENPQACQGFCRHTSCRACKFLEPIMICPDCLNKDFKCIRQFGRCMRRNACKAKSYPCGNTDYKSKMNAFFRCKVPECDALLNAPFLH